jgi:hypothetical protein
LSAAIFGLLGLFTLFYVVYGGAYRHESLLLAFFVALTWIARTDPAAKDRRAGWIHKLGAVALALLIGMQVLSGLHYLYVLTKMPTSRSRDFGALIEQHPELRTAVVIADPDFLVEPLSYYAPNPVYLMRQQIAGPLVVYTNKARLDLSLDDILKSARDLQRSRGAPVLILLPHDMDEEEPVVVHEGYNWTYRSTPEQVARFQANTTLLKTFGRALTDETFAVYELNGPAVAGAQP